MRKSIITKTRKLCVALGLSLALALTACGNKTDGTTEQSSSAAASEEVTEASETGTDDKKDTTDKKNDSTEAATEKNSGKNPGSSDNQGNNPGKSTESGNTEKASENPGNADASGEKEVTEAPVVPDIPDDEPYTGVGPDPRLADVDFGGPESVEAVETPDGEPTTADPMESIPDGMDEY